MKATEIHNGLDKSHIREFLSKTLNDILHQDADSTNNKRVPPFNQEDPFQWAIDQASAEITFWQFQLEKANARKSVFQLIKMNNWSEHDVSDYISLEPGKKFSKTFIGTDEEYKALISRIEKNG